MRSKIRIAMCLSTAVLALALPACMSDGHFSLFGYSSVPNYDNRVKTVYVPMFKNRTMRRRLEYDLTRAVVREIEQKTDFKVVSDRDRADSELVGVIHSAVKGVWNRNQQNTIREGQTELFVDVYWRDLRTGEILSAPRDGALAPGINRRLAQPPLLQPLPGPGMQANNRTVDPLGLNDNPRTNRGGAPATTVRSFGMYIPELGGSNATSWQENVNRAAVQIISLMEKPW